MDWPVPFFIGMLLGALIGMLLTLMATSDAREY